MAVPMVDDARESLQNNLNRLKETLTGELGWATPNQNTVDELNRRIALTQRCLDNLPQTVE